MRIILGLFLGYLCISCCAGPDVIVSSTRLTDFERALIPYSINGNYDFVTNEGDTIFSRTDVVSFEVDDRRAGPESCRIFEFETGVSRIGFPQTDIFLPLNLRSGEDSRAFSNITVRSVDNVVGGRYRLVCNDDTDFVTYDSCFFDVTINDFSFINVLVFQNQSENSNEERIIFSLERGVEYIEFDDGTWFKILD